MQRNFPATSCILVRRVLFRAARLLASHQGQALAEYAFLLSLIALVVMGTLIVFGQTVNVFLVNTACAINPVSGC